MHDTTAVTQGLVVQALDAAVKPLPAEVTDTADLKATTEAPNDCSIPERVWFQKRHGQHSQTQRIPEIVRRVIWTDQL